MSGLIDTSTITPPEGDNKPAATPASTPAPAPAGNASDNLSGNQDSTAVPEGLYPLSDLNDYLDPENKLLLGKYKTPRELAEGYKELTTKLREKNPGAPDQYEFKFEDESLKTFKPDGDPLFEKMLPVLKNKGISQEQASAIVREYLLYQQESLPSTDDMKKMLGDDADTVINEINQAVPKLAKTQDDKDALDYIGAYPPAMRLLHTLLRQMGERPIPGSQVNPATGGTQQERLQVAFDYLKANPDLASNPDKQAKYDALMKAAHQ